MGADKWEKVSWTRLRYRERRNMPKYSNIHFLFKNKDIEAYQG